MKKIVALVIVFIAAMFINSCGTSTKMVTNDPYSGEGYGESYINKNIAREKAYDNAVADITRKYARQVLENARQEYSSDERGKGRSNENLAYNSILNERSEAFLNDIVITKERTRLRGRKWVSEIVVAVSPDNIE